MKTGKDKAKAKELVDKFKNYVAEKDFFGDDRSKENAIECAKIAVDEIISTLSLDFIRVSNRLQTKEYWQEVKNELNRL